MDVDDWDVTIDTNIKGLLYFTHAALKRMLPAKRGQVINLSSMSAAYAYPTGNVYAGTKAFVTHFSMNLRSDLAGTPIRVNVVELGLTATDFLTKRYKGDMDKAEAFKRGVVTLMPEDLAAIMEFLVRLPARVNVDRVQVMPISQSYAGATTLRNDRG
jgi:3-hydroxy acid dehydrogenase/malonic semialdehyde reductase